MVSVKDVPLDEGLRLPLVLRIYGDVAPMKVLPLDEGLRLPLALRIYRDEAPAKS